MTDDTRDFNLSDTNRLEAGKARKRRVFGLLGIALCAAGATLSASAMVMHYEAESLWRTPGGPTGTETALQKAVFAKKIDFGTRPAWTPTGAAQNETVRKRIEAATVMIIGVANDGHWRPVFEASATVLADQRIDGHKALVSVLSAVGDRSLDQDYGVKLVAVDRDGAILGVVRPVDATNFGTDKNVPFDRPELLGFDPAYRVNTTKLAAIQGVAVAPRVPAGLLTGRTQGPVGITEGGAGGGWYNAKGQMIGVTAFGNAGPAGETGLVGKSFLPPQAIDTAWSDDGPPPRTPVHVGNGRDLTVVGLGDTHVLNQLQMATIAGAVPWPAADAVYRDATGFGYPSGIIMGWHASLTQHTDYAAHKTLVATMNDASAVRFDNEFSHAMVPAAAPLNSAATEADDRVELAAAEIRRHLDPAGVPISSPQATSQVEYGDAEPPDPAP